MGSRGEALSSAKRVLRGFSAAPDPRRHALSLFSELMRADGWSSSEAQIIAQLGQWLNARPAVHELKPHMAKIISQLLGG